MYPELPHEWQVKLDKEIDYIQTNGFYLTNLEAIKSQPKVLSVVFVFNDSINQELFEFVSTSAPQWVHDEAFIQPYSGYHVSIQWSSVYAGADLMQLVQKIDDYFKKNPITYGLEVLGLYPSDNNLFLIPTVSDKTIISKTRSDITQMFLDSGVEPKLPQNLDTLWMSVVRFTSQPTPEKINELITSLPHKSFPDIHVNHVKLALGDPFLSPESAETISTEQNIR